MYREFFSHLESAALPLIALGFFLLAFMMILLRTFLFKRKRDYDEIASLPLEDSSPADRPEVKP